MTKKPEDLIERKERLKREIEEYEQKLQEAAVELDKIEAAEYAEKVKEVNDLIKAYKIKPSDIDVYLDWARSRKPHNRNNRNDPKTPTGEPKSKPEQIYKDPATGKTHSGKGNLPPWLKAAQTSDEGVIPRTFKKEFYIVKP